MTEPTQAQIEEAKRLRAQYAFMGSLDVYTTELANLIAHIRREASDAGIEKAAKMLDIFVQNRGRYVVINCADAAAAIRALKDQP